MVLRETVSSYTWTVLIDSEKHQHLREALLILCSEIGLHSQDPIRIRVDAAPGLSALSKDPSLTKYNIILDIGNIKNKNKNPVAERAIQELGLECLDLSPEGGSLSKLTLALATYNMNSRLRNGGLAAIEVWTQRDQISGDQLPIDDREYIIKQQISRLENHNLVLFLNLAVVLKLLYLL